MKRLKTSLALDPKIHKRAMVRARDRGELFCQLVERAITRELETFGPGDPAPRTKKKVSGK